MANKKAVTTKLQAAYHTFGIVGQKDNWRILQLLNIQDQRPIDMAYKLAVGRNNLNLRLKELAERGLITKKIISNNNVWYSINHYNYALIMVGVAVMSMDYKEITFIQ